MKLRPDWIRVDHPDPANTDSMDVSGVLREATFNVGDVHIKLGPDTPAVSLESILDELAERFDDAHEQYLQNTITCLQGHELAGSPA